MSGEEIEAFAAQLAADVEEAVSSGTGSVYTEEEFTRIVLERLGEDGAVENPTMLWEEGQVGRHRYKITGYSMAEDAERLLLVATVHTGELPPRPLTRSEITTACDLALKFYECSCGGLHTSMEPSNTDASELARRIYQARDQLSTLRLLLLSDGMTGLSSVDLKPTASDGTRMVVDMYGIERLQRVLGQGLARDDITVDLAAELGSPLPCIKASGATGDFEAYLGAIPGSVLASVYEKYGTRLLELNVRAFLGLRGRKSVNAGLRSTILELPHRFLAYNNGIVATVDDIEAEDFGNGMTAIRTLRGLQIVNGGQTTASLHRARRQDKARLDDILVPIKIIKADGGNLQEMVTAVSRSANSQNTVQPADFSANNAFHVAVEELANNTWLPDASGRWFYERARGSYGAAEYKASIAAAHRRRFAKETPKERRFSKTDLAKYLNAWNGLPHLVSFGNQKNFQHFMQTMKEENSNGFKPDTAWFKAFIAKAIIFRSVHAIVRACKFPAYQANIVAYTVAALGWVTARTLDFDQVWGRQDLSPEMQRMLQGWVHEIDKALRETAGNRMPSEWAKKVDCRDALRAIVLPLPKPLPPEFANLSASPSPDAGTPFREKAVVSREDLELLNRTRGIGAETWFRVAQWGGRTKKLHWKVAAIARTMGEYALADWERGPSVKQAKWALEAYDTAAREGAFEETTEE